MHSVEVKERMRGAPLARRRSLVFLARFIGILFFFFFAVALRPVNDVVIVPFTGWIAAVSAILLKALGEAVTVDGTEIRSTEFAVNIQNGCNGLETVLLFGSAVLAFPANWQRRAVGLFAGFLAIELLNFVRVASLFWVGRHRPALFSPLHTVLWQSVMVIFGVVLFLLWARQMETALSPGASPSGAR